MQKKKKKKVVVDSIVRKLGQAPEVIKLFMLNSVEHEILNAHEYENIKKFSFF